MRAKTRDIALAMSCTLALALATAATRGASPDPPSAAVGITLSMRSPIRFSGLHADVVYFVRLNHEESLDAAVARGELFASNEAQADRLLLLGTTPGTYVAVAAAYRKSYSGQYLQAGSIRTGRSSAATALLDPFASEDVHRTYFSRALVESTRVTVGPDSIVHAGELELQQINGIDEGDVIQRRVQELLEPDSVGSPEGLHAPSQWISYEGTFRELRRDSAAELRFLDWAAKRLRKTKWAPLFERRRTELRAISGR